MLNTLVKKRPNSELFKITTENWSESQFDELLSAQGLFDQKYIVILDGLFEKKDIKEYVLEKLPEMKEAKHPFLILEGKIDAPTLKKIERIAEKVQEFTKPEGKKETYNIFYITDGLLARDKKKLWIDYVDLLSKGAAAEEIHGILFWQVKNMILTSCADSMKETGLTPYQYKNALTGSRKYKEDELLKMSSDLVEMTHKVRSGEGDLDVMLEKWVLSV
jgi:hypothetical protein